MNKQIIEKGFEKAIWYITKYASEEDHKNGKILERVMFGGNALVNEGINYLLTMIGTDAKTGTPWSNANANLIVGTGTPVGTEAPVAAVTNTEATFTNPVKKVMMSGFPTYGTDQKTIWKSSYGATEANQAWYEFGVLNAAASGTLLNRKVSAQGTKVSGQVWELELQITVS